MSRASWSWSAGPNGSATPYGPAAWLRVRIGSSATGSAWSATESPAVDRPSSRRTVNGR